MAGITTLVLAGSIVAVQADSSDKVKSAAKICRMLGSPLVAHRSGARAPDGPRRAWHPTLEQLSLTARKAAGAGHMAVTIESYRLHAWQQIPIVELRT